MISGASGSASLRIGFLAFNYPMEQPVGGVGTYTRVLALALQELGHRPHVLLADAEGPPHTIREGIPIYRIGATGLAAHVPFPIGRGASISFACRLARVARSLQLDVLEAPEGTGMTAFLNWVKPAQLKTVVRLHTGRAVMHGIYRHLAYSTVERAKQRVVHWAERQAIVTADGVSSVSQALVNKTKSVLGIRRNDFHVLPSPVERALFEPRDVLCDPDLILFVGRLDWGKGCDTLIRALPKILESHPKARLVLAGADTDTAPGSISMRAWLKDNASADCWKHVELPGQLSGRALQQLYRTAAVFVLPSRWEGLPIAAQEAMCCGTAIVAARSGGIVELVRHNETGLLVDAEDPRQLAEAVSALVADPSRREGLACCARQYALKEFEPAHIARRMLPLYYGQPARA